MKCYNSYSAIKRQKKYEKTWRLLAGCQTFSLEQDVACQVHWLAGGAAHFAFDDDQRVTLVNTVGILGPDLDWECNENKIDKYCRLFLFFTDRTGSFFFFKVQLQLQQYKAKFNGTPVSVCLDIFVLTASSPLF